MLPTRDHYDYARQRLASLSLEAQVGQLLTVFFAGSQLTPAMARMIQDYHVGGLILYAENTPNAHAVAELVQGAQRLSQIPLWISIDQEGGGVVRLEEGVTAFPAPMAVAAAGSLDAARQMSCALGTELRQLGINLTYAPVLDVNTNPANPVIGIRSFGRDPEQVAQWGRAAIQGYEQAGIMCCGKHYPGHGDTSVDSHLGLPVVDHPEDRLGSEAEFPFRQAIAAGIPSLMTAHLLVTAWDRDQPATLSRRVLTERLRHDLGFTGVIITDSLSMGALQSWGSLGEVAVAAFLAGADMLLLGADVGHTPAEQIPVYEALLTAVQQGVISRERLQASVFRLLTYKSAYAIDRAESSPPPFPLPEIPSPETSSPELQPPEIRQPSSRRLSLTVSTPEHQHLAQTLAQQSLTLIPAHSPRWRDPVVCFYPADLYDLGSLLVPLCPHLIGYPYQRSLPPPPPECPPGVIWVAIHNLGRFPQQQQLVESLPRDRTLVINTGSPYDLADSPYHRLITYGHQPLCLKAVAHLLTSSQPPRGQNVFA